MGDALMLRVALTGGIGSGKTTAARFFAQQGIPVIDADRIAHELTACGAAGYAAIVEHFGEVVLTAGGQLDRRKLRQVIFNDPAAKHWLEQTLHPLILQIMRQRIDAVTSAYCILIIPLLAETELEIDFIDRVCLVDAPEGLRKQWASQRDQVSPQEITAIIDHQSSREQRLAIADDVIVNDGDLKALEQQVKKLHQKYSALSL